jgi:hypothetical protein
VRFGWFYSLNTTDNASSQEGIEIRIDVSSALEIVLPDTNNTAFATLTSSSVLNKNTWNEITIIKNGNDLFVVKDSNLVASSSLTSKLGGNHDWTLGAQLNEFHNSRALV